MRKITKIIIFEEFKIELTYDNIQKIILDFKNKIETNEFFQALQKKEYFSQVSISESGRYIYWNDEIEFCADALWYEATGEKF